MAINTIDRSAGQPAQLLVNAINRLRLARSELQIANSLIQQMDDAEITALVGFSGSGAALQTALAAAVATLETDATITNAIDKVTWS